MQTRDGIAWWQEGGIARIELRRPERANALSSPAAAALALAITETLALAPKVVLLTAQGAVFCAGGDIGEFSQAGARLPELVDEILRTLHPAVQRLAQGPAPVVSAVGGAVGGAGVGLALCADFVLAARSMKLRTGYAAIGLSPDVGSSYFLARRIGAQRAKQWLLLSEPVDAATCLAAGAVDALHDAAELPAAALALATRLAAGARASQAGIKALCDGMVSRDLGLHLALEHEHLSRCARSADAVEGVAAFLAKRPPRFAA